MVVHGCTWLYMVVHGCIWLYIVVHGCTILYFVVPWRWMDAGVQYCKRLYKALLVIQSCIWLYMVFIVYIIVQMCTLLYTCVNPCLWYNKVQTCTTMHNHIQPYTAIYNHFQSEACPCVGCCECSMDGVVEEYVDKVRVPRWCLCDQEDGELLDQNWRSSASPSTGHDHEGGGQVLD